MATRTVKSDSGNDLKLQNNGGTGSVTITDAGDLTIDSPADIVLDAEGADITLKDGGTAFGTLKQASGHLVIQPESSKEIILNDQAGTASLTVDTANQNVSINNGNIVMGTADKGIDFSAQTATSATGATTTAEILNSYEEGTWTVEIADAGSDGNTATADTAVGKYTKIGNQVNVNGFFEMASESMEGENMLYIRGFPFAASSTANTAYVGVVYLYRVNTQENTTLFMDLGSSVAYCQQKKSGGSWDSEPVSCGDIQYASTCSIRVNITYQTD